MKCVLKCILTVMDEEHLMKKHMNCEDKGNKFMWEENGGIHRAFIRTFVECAALIKVSVLCSKERINKDIWDRVKLLMQGTSLSKQERECKLYNEFDKFSYVKVQVNTKFLNSLPPKWGKFVTDVKLAKDLHTSNYDQLYAYLEQHEPHSTLCYSNAYPPPTIPQQPQAEFPQIDSGLVVPIFLLGCDPIAYMNKAMAFLSTVFTPRYPSTNNQLRSSSNPRNQATVQDGVVTVQQVQGRQDPRVADGQVAQTITHNATFQTDDLDAYDSDCDDISSAKAILMANLSSCD
ncbi:hypothetical protein Tco_1288509 [Tanacetum coccineum]